MTRRPLSNRAREKLWNRECGDQQFPRCNIPWCGQFVRTGERWVESHYPVPDWLGGEVTGIAHARCNAEWWAKIEAPQAAHVKRVHQKHIGAWRSRRPLPGGRDTGQSKKINGQVVRRTTGAQKHAAMMAKLRIV